MRRIPETILVVEDEVALRETLLYKLQKEGFDVQAVADGRSAVDTARRIKPDLILLDLMLPQMDGFDVCRILRRETNASIIMLTARDGENDRVTGLEVGADDYLTKPFSMRELLARVKAQFRRLRLVQEEMKNPADISQHEMLVFGNLVINITRRMEHIIPKQSRVDGAGRFFNSSHVLPLPVIVPAWKVCSSPINSVFKATGAPVRFPTS